MLNVDIMDMNMDLMTIGEASKYLRISKDTLRRWERNKIIKPYRSPTGWRYYDKKQLDYVYSKKPEFQEIPTSNENKIVPTRNKKKVKAKIQKKQKYNYKSIYLSFILIVIINIIFIMIYMIISP